MAKISSLGNAFEDGVGQGVWPAEPPKTVWAASNHLRVFCFCIPAAACDKLWTSKHLGKEDNYPSVYKLLPS